MNKGILAVAVLFGLTLAAGPAAAKCYQTLSGYTQCEGPDGKTVPFKPGPNGGTYYDLGRSGTAYGSQTMGGTYRTEMPNGRTIYGNPNTYSGNGGLGSSLQNSLRPSRPRY